jgi:TonB family protein
VGQEQPKDGWVRRIERVLGVALALGVIELAVYDAWAFREGYLQIGRAQEAARVARAAATAQQKAYEAQFYEHRSLVYPALAQRKGEEGNVLLELSIDERGQVVDAQIKRSSGSAQLDAAALLSVGYWRYHPIYKDGKPVARPHWPVMVQFRLR